MDFISDDFEAFSSAIELANEESSFSVKFFRTGSFVQVTNSTGKVHDLSFQAVLQSLVDIRNNDICQRYIQYCYENPALVEATEEVERQRYERFCIDLEGGNIVVGELSRFKYFEKPLRVMGKTYFTDERARVVAAEQTKLLFNVISRFVHIASGATQTALVDAEMPFSYKKIEKTIGYIENLISFCTVHTGSVAGALATSSAAVNKIYYGAPGTGKSHTIDEQTAGARKVVTVFHPDTQHSDFVGALKPMMQGDDITYQFRPGPFTNALIEALTHPKQHVYLIIEEINRAPAAAVFGELFQLLDRKDGASKYQIDAADPDMLAYINNALPEGCRKETKIRIPANLSLLATMNSSDQAVMPLDTAFKRRWSFRYIKIDFSNQDVSDQTFRLMTSQGPVNISWRDFADKVINHYLKELNVPEDRLLGPFFLSETELSDEASAKDALCGKLFVYLWDDVLRHRGRNIIFEENIRTFGELHDTFLAGKNPVFMGDVDAAVYKLGKAASETEEPEESGEDA